MKRISTVFLIVCCLSPFQLFGAYMGDINSGDTMTGSLSALGQQDYWTFSGVAGDRVAIDCEATTDYPGYLNTELVLIGPDYINEATSGSGGDMLDHVLLKSGTYTIMVEDAGLDNYGSYALTLVNLTRGPLTSSGDPEGGAIASGQTVSGSIAQSDMDVYQFTGQAGDRVAIDCEATSDYPGYLDTELVLVDPDRINEATSGGGGDGLDRVLLKSGTYSVLVRDNGLDNYGSYALTLVNLTRGPLTSSGDPDGGVVVSAQTVSGSIAQSDMDVYQFTGQAGDRVVIDCEATSDYPGYLDTELVLVDPDRINEATSGGGGDALDRVLLKSGTYSVMVRDNGLDNYGSYAFTLMKMPGADSSPGDCDGGLIATGQSLVGSIAQSDMDAYHFYGQAGDRVMITCVATTGYPGYLDTEMILIDPDRTNEFSTSPGGDSMDRILAKTGLYTILVEDNGRDNYGSYNITFTKLPMTERPGIYNVNPSEGCNIGSSRTLTWNAVSGATGYDVLMSSGGLTPLQAIASNIQTNSLLVTNIDRGKTYYWKVIAHTPSGDIQGTMNWFVSVVPCDLNGDCRCDMQDWLLFGQRWGATNCSTVPCACDLNADGRCDMRDWLIFGQNWGFRMCP